MNSSTRWGRYLLAGALLAVLVASGISAQLFATSDTPHGSSLEDADPTLYAHGDRLRPLVEDTDGAQTLNIYGPGGQIIAQVARNGLGGSQKAPHLLADHLGSTRAILDADDNVVAHFEYGPHGETATSGVAAAEARYRYTGHPYDESQRLYETPARGYDPTTGRFLSVDPRRQDASPYVYAENNPVGFLDPTGGGKVPFFMRSGFWGASETEGFTSKGLTTLQVQSRHSFARDVGATLGMHGEQYIHDATRTFGSDPLKKPSILDHVPQFLRGSMGDRKFHYDDRLYWFIGDDKDIVLPTHFHESVQRIRAASREKFALFDYASPNFARNIVLVDFTQPGSDAIRRVSEFLSGGEYKVWRVTAPELLLLPPDDLQIPEPQEILDEMFPMEQQGPDAQGGAGPPPPPTSIDRATGQPTRQLPDNLQIPEPQEILDEMFPGQSQYSQPMREETGFGFTSEQVSAINAIPNLDSYVGD